MNDDSAPRADSHGEDCTMGAGTQNAQTSDTSPLTGRMAVIHCHDCWKFTDNARSDDNLVHEAAVIVVNGGTLTVENSEAFKAADAFLASRFKFATRMTVPRL